MCNHKVNKNVDIDDNCLTFSAYAILIIDPCINIDENVNITISVFKKKIANFFFEIEETFYWSNSRFADIEFWTKCNDKCCRMWAIYILIAKLILIQNYV